MKRESILKNFLHIGKVFASFTLIAIGLYSCHQEQPKTIVNKDKQHDTIQKEFVFTGKKDTLIQDGESIKYYKSGRVEMRGMMKNGKRGGVWKSYYEDGSPWSETTFLDGKKSGKTTAWFNNKKKRYEGFYSNDAESGHWTFWDENGKIQKIKNN